MPGKGDLDNNHMRIQVSFGERNTDCQCLGISESSRNDWSMFVATFDNKDVADDILKEGEMKIMYKESLRFVIYVDPDGFKGERGVSECCDELVFALSGKIANT